MIDKLLRALGIRADNLYSQPTKAPTRKVGTALWAGALVFLIQYFAVNVWGVEIDNEVAETAAGVILALLSFLPGIGAYIVKEKS